MKNFLEEIKNAAEKFIASIKIPSRCKKCKRFDCEYRLDDFKNFSAEVRNNFVKLKDNYEKFLATGGKTIVADKMQLIITKEAD